MSKKFIITEEETNNIKLLYNIGESAGDIIPSILATIFSSSKDETNSSNTDGLPNTTTSDDDFYKSVLKCIGAEPTKGNMLFMYAWRQTEGGKAKNNPFNTTLKMGGATNISNTSVGVKNYQTPEDGIRATCKTLLDGRDKYNYGKIIDGLKNDVGLEELSKAVVNSSWGTKDLLVRITNDYIAGISPKPHTINKTELV